MSSDERSMSRVSDAVRAVVLATDRFTDAASSQGDLHRTDLIALAALMDAGDTGLSPGRLGLSLGLSSPATTALVDRLERAGHVTRTRRIGDRRAVDIHVTDHALTRGAQLYSPLFAHLSSALESFTDDQLEIASRVLRAIETATLDATTAVTGQESMPSGTGNRAPDGITPSDAMSSSPPNAPTE